MALEFVSEVDKKFFNDNLLLNEDWDDGCGKLPEDLSDLLDTDANMTSDDLLRELSDNLEIPMMDDITTSQYAEQWHFSDSSDSGLDCGMSIKEEPLSPSSSDVSDQSVDAYSQMFLEDTLQQFILPDELKIETPPLSPPSMLSDPFNLSTIAMDTTLTTTGSDFVQMGMPIATVANNQGQNVTQVINSKIKIKPKPLQPLHPKSVTVTPVPAASVASTAGKPLVLTAEEFAKLTQQGILKIQPSVTTAAPVVTPTLMAPKPIMTTSALQLKPAVTPVPANTDSKAMKRQQRMIKNRESACLSRKRKKEYLSNMEDRLKQYLMENEKLKQANSQLKKKVEILETENQRLKSGMPFNTHVKRASILLGVMLLFAVNLWPMASILQNDQSPVANGPPPGLIHHGRTLMSVNENIPQDPTPQRPLPADPYTLLRETLRHSGSRTDLISRKALEEYTIPISMCPSYFNSTESMRLMDELNGWVMGHKHEWSKTQQQEQPQKRKPKRKLRRNRTQKKLYSPEPRDIIDTGASERSYEVQLFTGADTNYQEFFNAIHRRNDTFYVVSFRRDHLLLPATAHNKTMRPRMSLVMPAVDLGDAMHTDPSNLSMMQIDCEVTATKLVYLAKSAVPLELRENANRTQEWARNPPPTWHESRGRHVPGQ